MLFTGNPKDTVFDVMITHPLQSKYANPSTDNRAGLAAADGERLKRTKHGEACERAGKAFSPFVAEYYGTIGSDTRKLFDRAVRNRAGVPTPRSACGCRNSLSAFTPLHLFGRVVRESPRS